jgi:DNA-binding transcriptional LysR family regulator
LVTASAAAAPSVRLDLCPSGTLDIVDRLDRGDLDLALGSLENPGERFAAATLLEDPIVMVMRCGHPAGLSKLSPKSFADLPHLEISSSGEDTGSIDRWLARYGLVRRIALRAPYLSAAPILVQSDMIAILSRRIAQEFVRSHPLEIREPPYASPRVRTAMLWHRRLDSHPVHRWLRTVVLSVSRSL